MSCGRASMAPGYIPFANHASTRSELSMMLDGIKTSIEKNRRFAQR
jgi:hypothetical protein